jgi:hypothetical protein
MSSPISAGPYSLWLGRGLFGKKSSEADVRGSLFRCKAVSRVVWSAAAAAIFRSSRDACI